MVRSIVVAWFDLGKVNLWIFYLLRIWAVIGSFTGINVLSCKRSLSDRDWGGSASFLSLLMMYLSRSGRTRRHASVLCNMKKFTFISVLPQVFVPHSGQF